MLYLYGNGNILNNLTYERVRELFDYDPETGKLTWKVKKARPVKIGDEVGSLNGNGYRATAIDGKGYMVHRLIWLWMTGEMPEQFIDHKNGDGLDNRWENLRLATNQQNCLNQKKNSNNQSGYKNICKATTRQFKNGILFIYEYWRVKIAINGKEYVKQFPFTEEGLQQAITYRDTMLETLHLDFARFD